MSFLEYFNLTEKEQEIFKTVCQIYPLENSWDKTFSVRDINNYGHEFTVNAFNNLVNKAIFNKDKNVYSFNKEKLLPCYQAYQKNLDIKIEKLTQQKEILLLESNNKFYIKGIILLLASIIIPSLTVQSISFKIILILIIALFGFKMLLQPSKKKKKIKTIDYNIEHYNKQKLNIFS